MASVPMRNWTAEDFAPAEAPKGPANLPATPTKTSTILPVRTPTRPPPRERSPTGLTPSSKKQRQKSPSPEPAQEDSSKPMGKLETKIQTAALKRDKVAAANAEARGDLEARQGALGAYMNQVAAQSGKALTRRRATTLNTLAQTL